MKPRPLLIIIIFLIGFLIASGCTTKSPQSTEITTPTPTPFSTTQSMIITTPPATITTGINLDRSVDLANKIIPDSIPGLELKSKAKSPMSGQVWGDKYTLSSYWEPRKGSKYDGPICCLNVDVIIYENLATAEEWYSGVFEKLADGPIEIEGKKGHYRYDNGESTISVLQDNLIILVYGNYDLMPPDLYHEEGIVKEITLDAATRAIDNLNIYS